MNSSPLKDARLRIELDTKDAQARLDALEEKMDHIGDEIKHGEDQIKDQTKRTDNIAKKRLDRDGRKQSDINTTGPGKFGIRQIPQLLSAESLAGYATGLIPGTPPAIPQAARMAVSLADQYGALGVGMAEGMVDQLGLSRAMTFAIKTTLARMESMRKKMIEYDIKLKSVFPAIDQTIEMAKAQVLTGGHVSGAQLEGFLSTAYDWQFVNARKDKDIQDKTMKALGQEGGKVITDFFMEAIKGKIVH